MLDRPNQAAAEGLPKNVSAKISTRKSDLIDIIDKLFEARDFCEAIFMAAASLSDPAEVSVFQRLAQVVKDRAREAIDIAEALGESSK